MISHRSSVSIPRSTSVWKDPRLVIGIIVLLASIIACTQLIASARAGIPVYRSTRPIAQGESLGPHNTVIIDARPESTAYLPGGELPSDAQATINIGAGELIARSAITTEAQKNRRNIVISVSDGLPDTVTPGTSLELWFVPNQPIGTQEAPKPSIVTKDATLVKVLGESGILAGQGSLRIEVRFNVTDISKILESAHGNGTLSAVPVGL
ncbi:hypothetical protein [Schaalia sp. Marseille-Q2122]|uniref:hypothetical protein n=1 Tax=Schaalia sp. Marseille-Q2122 TaxID=2736604 RepID=UPI0015892BBB|nr:hypothetical protein [Schaalia sp. Marseille-Q2122]